MMVYKQERKREARDELVSAVQTNNPLTVAYNQLTVDYFSDPEQ